MSDYSVISLFSGIGGIDLGFRQAGFNIVWSNDIDEYCCKTYNNNFPNRIYQGDIRHIGLDVIPYADVLIAGFPCQPFSIMGHKKGFSDARGNLFFEIVRVAEYIKPPVILLENVKNLIYHDKGRTFITIFNELAQIGYMLKYAVLDAYKHGNIPQTRRRIFIAAFREEATMNRFSFPDKIKPDCDLNGIIDRTVKHSDIYYYKNDSRYYDELNKKIQGLTGMYRIDDSGVANKQYRISPTLKANMGTYHDRVPIIRDEFGIRKLTPYECLALQGFPDEFSFKGIPLNEVYKQIGNTVCVPVVKRIAINIKKAMDMAGE